MKAILILNEVSFNYETQDELDAILLSYNVLKHKEFLQSWYTKITGIRFIEKDFPFTLDGMLDLSKISIDLHTEKMEKDFLVKRASSGKLLKATHSKHLKKVS